LERIVLSWSGGKDGALTLYEIQHSIEYAVSALLTTITQDYARISMHGVRQTLLERQAESVGLPLLKVFIPANCTNEIYAEIMEKEMNRLKSEGINAVAFGDIFLQDVREYRENNLAKVGMKAIFPLWGRNSRELVKSFINLGFKSIIATIDPRKLSKEFCGRIIDSTFLDELPQDVDPAGENGEFHSFVFDGPVFKNPIHFSVGEKVLRDNFWFCDLLPVA
jgi:uncharacterized protein (TIGR00290 family)